MIRADAIADGAWKEITSALASYIGRRVSDRADRDDLVQEVLLRIHRGSIRLESEAASGAWIYSIANNAVIDHWRHKARRQPAPLDPCEIDVELRDPPDDDALQQGLAEYLASRIALLPSPYRETLTLTELQGTRQADAAAMLGVSVVAAKSRVLRGRALLRQALTECCAIELGATGQAIDCIPQVGNPCGSSCGCCPAA